MKFLISNLKVHNTYKKYFQNTLKNSSFAKVFLAIFLECLYAPKILHAKLRKFLTGQNLSRKIRNNKAFLVNFLTRTLNYFTPHLPL